MSDCPDCTDLATQITEAEAALHRLMTGKAKVSVSFGAGKRVEYTQASIEHLRGYIAELKDKRSNCCPGSTTAKKRGTVRFMF